MHENLTPHRREVLQAVGDYQDRCGYPPSLRELSEVLGRSLSTIFGHLIRLERGGYLTRRPRKTRNIRLTPRGRQVLSGSLAENDRLGRLAERVRELESALGVHLGILGQIPWEVLSDRCPYAGPVLIRTARLLEEAA